MGAWMEEGREAVSRLDQVFGAVPQHAKHSMILNGVMDSGWDCCSFLFGCIGS